MIAQQRYRIFQHRVRDQLFLASNDEQKRSSPPMCLSSANGNREHGMPRTLQSSDTGFRCIRNHLQQMRCQVLSRLMQQGVTGSQLIRAFEEMSGDENLISLIECIASRPTVVETASMSNLNMSDDKFIDQLVQITTDRITDPLYRCASISTESPQQTSSSTEHDERFSLTVSWTSLAIDQRRVVPSSHRLARIAFHPNRQENFIRRWSLKESQASSPSHNRRSPCQ